MTRLAEIGLVSTRTAIAPVVARRESTLQLSEISLNALQESTAPVVTRFDATLQLAEIHVIAITESIPPLTELQAPPPTRFGFLSSNVVA